MKMPTSKHATNKRLVEKSKGANQSEGLTERINEPPRGRCLQGAVDARWVVASSSPRIASSRALGITVTLRRSNGDAFMGFDDGATLWNNRGRVTACLYHGCGTTGGHFGLIVLRDTASLFCHQ